MPLGDVRKHFTLGLVGGNVPVPGGGVKNYPARQYPAIVVPQVYPEHAYLVQTMVLGNIDQPMLDVFKVFIADQQLADVATMLNNATPALPGIFKELTDWDRTSAVAAFATAGDRVTSPLNPGDTALPALLTLLLRKGVSLADINAGRDETRTTEISEHTFRPTSTSHSRRTICRIYSIVCES